MPFVNEKLPDGKWVTIDYDRNIILSKISGPNSEGWYHCELIFEGQMIRFNGFSGMKIHGHPKTGENRQYEMNWQIVELLIPRELQEKQQEITQLITEALYTWGWNFNQEKAYSVSVTINLRSKGSV